MARSGQGTGVWLTLSLALTGIDAHAAPSAPARVVGCWDNDGSGAAHKALCFFEGGQIERREDGRFDNGRVAWVGSYRVSADRGALAVWARAQPARTESCRISFVTQRMRYFDKVAGSRVTADWPQLRVVGCDLAGEWLKSCSKFEFSYGSCPRSELPTNP